MCVCVCVRVRVYLHVLLRKEEYLYVLYVLCVQTSCLWSSCMGNCKYMCTYKTVCVCMCECACACACECECECECVSEHEPATLCTSAHMCVKHYDVQPL